MVYLAVGVGDQLELLKNDVVISIIREGVVGCVGEIIRLDGGCSGGHVGARGGVAGTGGAESTGNGDRVAAGTEVHRGQAMGACEVGVLPEGLPGLRRDLNIGAKYRCQVRHG